MLAVALALILAGQVLADRTPSVRASGERDHGTRPNIFVPYLTTGYTTFGAYYVEPRIYRFPVADDPANPAIRATYNLPFYTGRMGFGSGTNGYVPKPTLLPSNAK
jgi:hypothetical protein